MMRGLACRQAGLTLLEVLIAGILAMLIGTFLVAILSNNMSFFTQQNNVINEGLSLNDTLGPISDFIRQASKVADGYPEGSPQYTTDTDTLVLKLPTIGSTGAISDTFDFVVVAKDSSNPTIFRLLTFPDAQSTRLSSDRVLTTILDSVSFEYFDQSGSVAIPSEATSVKTTLSVLSKTGIIGTPRSIVNVTKLRNL